MLKKKFKRFFNKVSDLGKGEKQVCGKMFIICWFNRKLLLRWQWRQIKNILFLLFWQTDTLIELSGLAGGGRGLGQIRWRRVGLPPVSWLTAVLPWIKGTKMPRRGRSLETNNWDIITSRYNNSRHLSQTHYLYLYIYIFFYNIFLNKNRYFFSSFPILYIAHYVQ